MQEKKISKYVNNIHWKEAMYTATHLQVYYSNLFDFCSCTQTICSDIAVVIPFLNVPQCTLSYLIHSQIYFRGVLHDFKKKNKKKKEKK